MDLTCGGQDMLPLTDDMGRVAVFLLRFTETFLRPRSSSSAECKGGCPMAEVSPPPLPLSARPKAAGLVAGEKLDASSALHSSATGAW